MGRGRWLCYAANVERRQRESEETERKPGARPLVGRGVGPKPPRFLQWERLWEENFQRTMQRGRSRPTFMPRPFIQIHHTYVPHHLPCCPVVRFGQFGYVDPNAPSGPRVNNSRPCLPCPQSYVLAPPLPQDPEASTDSSPSESSDAEEGDSLEVCHSLP